MFLLNSLHSAMELLHLMIALLALVVRSNQAAMESLDDILVYPVEPTTNIKKREAVPAVSASDKSLDSFIEDKLIQHSQALENLLIITQKNEELTKLLIENLGTKVLKPDMPEKVEVHNKIRRSNDDENENPIERLGKKIPQYGNLLKNMIVKQFQNEPDSPTPLIEQLPKSMPREFMTRRSFDGKPLHIPSLKADNQISPWCAVAMVCRRSMNPVCGYDDNFGYGKFDDICHMLQVNCYWKYNFALVPNCRPNLLNAYPTLNHN